MCVFCLDAKKNCSNKWHDIQAEKDARAAAIAAKNAVVEEVPAEETTAVEAVVETPTEEAAQETAVVEAVIETPAVDAPEETTSEAPEAAAENTEA